MPIAKRYKRQRLSASQATTSGQYQRVGQDARRPPTLSQIDVNKSSGVPSDPSQLLFNQESRLTLSPHREPPSSHVLQRFTQALDLANRNCRLGKSIQPRQEQQSGQSAAKSISEDDSSPYTSSSGPFRQSSSLAHSNEMLVPVKEEPLRHRAPSHSLSHRKTTFAPVMDDLPAFLSDIPPSGCLETPKTHFASSSSIPSACDTSDNIWLRQEARRTKNFTEQSSMRANSDRALSKRIKVEDESDDIYQVSTSFGNDYRGFLSDDLSE